MTDLSALTQPLGPDISGVADINERGQIVGTFFPDDPGPSRAFVWDPKTRRVMDLGTLGGELAQARAINNSGIVVGGADIVSAVSHAFGVRVPMSIARCG